MKRNNPTAVDCAWRALENEYCPDIIEEFKEQNEHYHCSICAKTYDNQEKARECFLHHSEINILRYIAYTIYCSKFFTRNKNEAQNVDYDIWNDIETINNKFGFAKNICEAIGFVNSNGDVL